VTGVPRRAEQPAPTFLRHKAIRWLIAELIPFGCLAVGFTIIRAWPPAGFIGFIIVLFGTPTATIFYLYKVLGASVFWIFPLMVLGFASAFVGDVIFANSAYLYENGAREELAVTSGWWLAAGCLALLLALTVAAAIVNGERWMRRNRFNLPRNQFEAFIRSRGTLARLWLPR
jgi:hypothetical protein